MSKALAINAAQFLGATDRDQVFFSHASTLPDIMGAPMVLLDRKGENGCDKDTPSLLEAPEEHLQLLPYIVVRNEEDKILIYSRGDAGGEQGLIGLCSIGLGGHPEVATADKSQMSQACNLAMEAARELNEEIGYPLNPEMIGLFFQAFSTNDFHVIYDGAEDGRKNVGRRHLALVKVVRINSADISGFEAGVIEKASWLTHAEIKAKIDAGEITLEPWSKIVFDTAK